MKPLTKRGRPRVAAPKPGANVSTWLAPSDHDKIVTAAKAHETSVSGLLRTWLKRTIKSS